MRHKDIGSPQTAVVRPPAVRVERVDDPADFAALREAWDALLAASPADCFFLTWEWLHTWWKHLAGRRQLRLMVIRDGPDLTAVAPLARRPPALHRLRLFSAIEFLGTGTAGSDYLDVIIRRGREAEALGAFSDALADIRLTIELTRLSHGTSSGAALARQIMARGWSASETTIDVCPVVDLTGHTWESYLASLGAAHRYNFQRRLRNLNRQFNVRFEQVQTETERREALESLVTLHTQRWRTRGGSEAFSTPALLSFHDEISRLAFQRGWLRLFVLRLNGAPAAVFHGYRYGRSFYFFQSAFDPAFAKLSVGLVMMGLTIRRALEEGAAQYDMLHGDEPYKFHWARDVRTLSRCELFPPGVYGASCQRMAVIGARVRVSVRRLIGDPVAERIATRGLVGMNREPAAAPSLRAAR